MARIPIAPLGMALLFAAVGCNETDGRSLSEGELRNIAETALLRLEDFAREEWISHELDDNGDGLQLEMSGECGDLDQIDEQPGALIDVDSPEFDGPSGEQVLSRVSLFEDEAAAADSFDQLNDLLVKCKDLFGEAYASAVNEAVRKEAGHADVARMTDAKLEPLDFPAYGERANAWRLTYKIYWNPDYATNVYVDILMVGVDTQTGSISYLRDGMPPDRAGEERLLTTLVARLTAISTLLEAK